MNRRRFLQSLSAFGASPLLPQFLSSAMAADTSGYKALVCVFLFGGNDCHNTVVPFTTAEYNAYSAARGGPAETNGLALPQGALLPILNNTFGLHPALTNMASLFNVSRKLAVVANTGVLLAPTTLAEYKNKSVPLPPQLFSHSDMQSHWQTMRADYPADTGWGGRLADLFRPANTGKLPVSVSLGGGGVFMKGDAVSAYQVTPTRYRNGSIDNESRIAVAPRADIWWNWTGSDPAGPVRGQHPADPLQRDGRAVCGRDGKRAGYRAVRVRRDVHHNHRQRQDDLYPQEPRAGNLAHHQPPRRPDAFRCVHDRRTASHWAHHGRSSSSPWGASTITAISSAAMPVTGNKTLLAGKHYDLLREFDEAMKVFYDATVAMGVANNVTTMTMSDFGRTLKSNGQGSDHGWGEHLMVMGGAVNGGRIVGQMPPVALGHRRRCR